MISNDKNSTEEVAVKIAGIMVLMQHAWSVIVGKQRIRNLDRGKLLDILLALDRVFSLMEELTNRDDTPPPTPAQPH